MRRIHILSTFAVILAIPAAIAAVSLSPSDKTAASKPCFISGNAGYLLSGSGDAGHIVRIDNDAERPNLRMQLVEDPASADFVVVDDADAAAACKGASIVEHIAIDPAAAKPDLIVAISHAPAEYKIYLHSDHYTAEDAAALAAVIWQNSNRTGALRTVSR